MRIENNIAYTQKQQAAIDSGEYPLYLLAGAGTGKSAVVVNKIIELLKQRKATIEQIYAITFTNKATDEMKSRINRGLYNAWVECARNDGAEKARYLRILAETSEVLPVSTIHGFCEMLLRRYGLYINLPLNFHIQSLWQESRDIIEGIVAASNFPEVKNLSKGQIIRLTGQILDYCTNHGIVLSEEYLPKKADEWAFAKEAVLRAAIKAQTVVEEAKKNKAVLTPEDLMKYTIRLLENDYVRKKIAADMLYIFIDEYQDTNILQFEIVKILIESGVNVFLVGDEKQSIYGFRGADIGSSRKAADYITDKHKDKKEWLLNENFRASSELIKAINNIFSKTFYYKGQKLNFPYSELVFPENQVDMEIVGEPYSVEQSSVTNIIKSLMTNSNIEGKPIGFDDIFILCRTNRQLAVIEDELRRNNFPVITIGGKGFFGKKEIIDTYRMFGALLNTETAFRNELLFTDYYKAVQSDSEKSFDEILTELSFVIREDSVDSILEYLYDKTGIFSYYNSLGNFQASANLMKIRNIAGSELAREYLQPLDFWDYLSMKIETQPEEDEAEIPDEDKRKGVITIMTIHKAKGLSLPVVIIPNTDKPLVNEKRKPDFLIDGDKKIFALRNFERGSDDVDKEYEKLYDKDEIKNLEEEMRILYVAMTRAKSFLVLSYNKRDLDGDIVSWYNWVK